MGYTFAHLTLEENADMILVAGLHCSAKVRFLFLPGFHSPVPRDCQR